MTTETILERVNQKPFRPLMVETVGGTWIEVDRREDVFVYDRIAPVRVVIFAKTGRMFILEPDQIAGLEAS
jgi:hypothetical protein